MYTARPGMMKRTIGILLLLFAGVSAAVAIFRDAGGRADEVAPLPPGCRLVVYYFHTEKRCASCDTMEWAAKRAIEGAFAEELGAGLIAYRDINFQSRSNQALQSAYGLAFSTIILSSIDEGREQRHQRLDEVWQMLSDREALALHIEAQIRAMLEGD
jgi:hypothetical protein